MIRTSLARHVRAGHSTCIESLEARQLLSGITVLPPGPPSAGALSLRLGPIKPLFVGPETDLGRGGPESPGLLSTIEGVTFDEDAGNNAGTLFIPPDPNGAVGPGHVVSLVNSTIEFHTKDGAQQFSGSLRTFFNALGAVNSLFDPKVIYDTYNNRFVVVALEMTDTFHGAPSNTSRILLAVSDDQDPNGTWRYHAINSKLTIAAQERWADFPGFGVDANAVYVTANMFTFGATNTFGGSRLWIINKTPFYTAPGPNAATFTLHDPSTSAGLPGQAFSLQPAVMYGTGPAMMGTFLLSSNFSSGANEAVSIIRILNPLAGPGFSNNFIIPGDIHNQGVPMPDAPQSGSSALIDTGGQQILNAVWRNNNLYAATTVNPPTGAETGQATAHWYRFSADGVNAPTLADQGNISGEDIAPAARTFYPSVAVDNNGNFSIGFAASAPTTFPGAYYTVHAAIDPAGTVQSTGVLASGLDSYVRTFGGPDNRWGDYSGMSIDPSDDSFWVFNQYADTHGTPSSPPPEDGRWRTRWGHFSLTSMTPPVPGVPDMTDESDHGVSMTDNITNVNTPTFAGTGQNGLTVILRANGVQVGSGPVIAGVYAITTSLLTDGNYNITAEQTDGTNTSQPSAALPITIDTLAPMITTGPTFNFLIAAHSLTYGFNENVGPSLTSSDLFVLQLPATVVNTSLNYNGGTNVATFTFPGFTNGTLPDGSFTGTLSGTGVTDIAGNGIAGGTNIFDFFFLRGDANRDRHVTLPDFNILATNFGQSPRNFTQGDFNYDGIVGLPDFNLLATRFGTSVAPESFSTTRIAPGMTHQQLIDLLRNDDVLV